MSSTKVVRKIDWITIILYLCLVVFGWVNIYSASVPMDEIGAFSFSGLYGKQLVFILLNIPLIIFVLALEPKFYERFSSVVYLVAIVSLIGLFIFGKNVNGARAWYGIGSFTLQPSEFVKTATALAIAKYISDIQTNMKDYKDQLKSLLIMGIPMVLILLQPDAGSMLVFTAFFVVMYREGLPGIYMLVLFILAVVFIATIKFGEELSLTGIFLLLGSYYMYARKKRGKKARLLPIVLFFIVCGGIAVATPYIYNNVFKEHHRDRFVLWLRLEDDAAKMEQLKKDIGYNTWQSEQTISAGGFSGRGFLEGTRTRGHYVPEQETDYIFTVVGEEWGFFGTVMVVLLFSLLVLRIAHLAERQRSQFSRVYGYSVAGILTIHFLVNIGMVIGLVPTIGIPLPFFSYGGSSLWGFTILLFIFLKLDANRTNDWLNF